MGAPAARSATVRLHRGLYAEEAIAEAAETFADFARFGVRPEGEHWVVAVDDIDGEVDGDVVAEFCNFALAHTAVRRKGGHA
jgi:hypothetical protein